MTMAVEEQWKDVIRYEGLYQVSDMGRIKRVAPGKGAIANKILRTTPDNFGYLRVTLYNNIKKKNLRIHRLVLEAFVGPCPDGMESCHNDGNTSNAVITNLRWATHASNLDDKKQHGTQTDQSGSYNNNAKMNESQVLEVKRMLKFGKYLQKEIAKQFGISKIVISDINTSKTWSHVYE